LKLREFSDFSRHLQKLSIMELFSPRKLRDPKHVEYYPKQKLYNTDITGGRRSRSAEPSRRKSRNNISRRSRSIDVVQPQIHRPAKRVYRSRSVDSNRVNQMPARRNVRSQSTEGRNDGPNDPQTHQNMVAVDYLARSQALLTEEMFKIRAALDLQTRKCEFLTRQNLANQELIQALKEEVEEKNVQLEVLQNKLSSAENEIGKLQHN
jgi:hypothetical protein